MSPPTRQSCSAGAGYRLVVVFTTPSVSETGHRPDKDLREHVRGGRIEMLPPIRTQ